MKNGSLVTIRKNHDGSFTVATNAVLDDLYRGMFEKALKSATSDPDDIEHGISTVIFGCFGLEAYVNELVRIILSKEVPSEDFSQMLWDSYKRAAFHEKLKLVSVFADKSNQSSFGVTIQP